MNATASRTGRGRPRAALALLAAALAGAACSVALAGDPPCADPPAASAPPRLKALEQEIRHLERHLTALRRARNDLKDGKAEAAPTDDDARRSTEAAQRALREIQRYESARARASGHWGQAVVAKDDAKAAEARAAMDRIDEEFVAAIEKADDAKDAAKPASAKSGDKSTGDKDSGDDKGDGRKGKSGASKGGKPDASGDEPDEMGR